MDYDRAIVIGQRSFGKGSMQTSDDMAGPLKGLEIWKTENFWTLPSGNSIQSKGITPHISSVRMPGLEDKRLENESYESEYGWLSNAPFDRVLTRDALPTVKTILPQSCTQIRAVTFASLDDALLAGVVDSQLKAAKEASHCLKASRYKWASL